MVDFIAGAVIVGGVIFIFWRTSQYLKPTRVGKWTSLTMKVRNGRIHFQSKCHD